MESGEHQQLQSLPIRYELPSEQTGTPQIPWRQVLLRPQIVLRSWMESRNIPPYGSPLAPQGTQNCQTKPPCGIIPLHSPLQEQVGSCPGLSRKIKRSAKSPDESRVWKVNGFGTLVQPGPSEKRTQANQQAALSIFEEPFLKEILDAGDGHFHISAFSIYPRVISDTG